jgi:hypothetical protein
MLALLVQFLHDAGPVDMAVKGTKILTRPKGIHRFSKVVPERSRAGAIDKIVLDRPCQPCMQLGPAEKPGRFLGRAGART